MPSLVSGTLPVDEKDTVPAQQGSQPGLGSRWLDRQVWWGGQMTWWEHSQRQLSLLGEEAKWAFQRRACLRCPAGRGVVWWVKGVLGSASSLRKGSERRRTRGVALVYPLWFRVLSYEVAACPGELGPPPQSRAF